MNRNFQVIINIFLSHIYGHWREIILCKIEKFYLHRNGCMRRATKFSCCRKITTKTTQTQCVVDKQRNFLDFNSKMVGFSVWINFQGTHKNISHIERDTIIEDKIIYREKLSFSVLDRLRMYTLNKRISPRDNHPSQKSI